MIERPLFLVVALLSFPLDIARAADSPRETAARTGHFKTTFTERSPLSSAEALAPRIRPDPRRWPDEKNLSLPGRPANWSTQNWDYDLANESFDVYVPQDIRRPYGILVWCGATEFSPEWFPVLARHKLIFVNPAKRDRKHIPIGLWLDAVPNLKARYDVDESRVYSAGFSNGGARAAEVLRVAPELFHGCLCMAMDDFYETYQGQVTAVPSGEWAAGGADLDEIKRTVRIVLMRGQRDTFTPEQGRLQMEGLLLDGFRHVSLLVVPNIAHQHPGADYFEKGIAALEHPPELKPPTTVPLAKGKPSPGQIAQARRLLDTARFWHETSYPGHPGPREDRRCLRQILDDYPTTPVAAEAAVMLKQLGDATPPATTKPAP